MYTDSFNRTLLSHPWIRHQGRSQDTQLATPRVLQRQSSTQDVAAFAASAMNLKRAISLGSLSTSAGHAGEKGPGGGKQRGLAAQNAGVGSFDLAGLQPSQFIMRRKMLRDLAFEQVTFSSIDEHSGEVA